MEDASCMECGAWTHPDSEARNCIKDPCNYEVEKLMVTGTCETCPEYYHPTPPNMDGDATDCMQDTCALDTQIYEVTGTCKECAAYSHPDVENKNCITCDRQEGEIIQVNGTCKACPAQTYVGPMMHECVPDQCEEGQILTLEGDTSQAGEDSWCEDCEPYFVPNDDATACVRKVCPLTKKITKIGNCEDCPAKYYVDLETQTQCVQDDCSQEENKILNIRGQCELCPLFKHPNVDFTECVWETCTGNKYLKEDGFCESCPSGKRPDDSRRSCIKDTCDLATQISTDLGYCEDCGMFTHPDTNNTICVSDSCVENQILKNDGTCEDCMDYYHPDDDAKNCVQCDINGRDRDIWLTTGLCFTCPNMTYPGPQKHECINDECDETR